MRRRILVIAITSTLSLAAGVLQAGDDPAARAVKPRPDERYFVLGSNSEYFRPGMPRPEVPDATSLENYHLKQRILFLERKYAILEAEMRDKQREGSERAESSDAGEVTEPEPPAPIVQGVRSRALPRPLAEQPRAIPIVSTTTIETAKPVVAVADKIVRKTSSRHVRTVDLPPFVLGDIKPAASLPEEHTLAADPVVEPRKAVLPALPAVTLPSPTLTPATFTPATAREEEESVIETARQIMAFAKERVLTLLEQVSPRAREEFVLSSAPAVTTSRTGRIEYAPKLEVEPLPTVATKPEWVVLYRLRDPKLVKQVNEKLAEFRFPVTNREFVDGEYVMEIGAFDSEERARQRRTFLGEVVGASPEIRVRSTTVPESGPTAG